MVRLVFLGFTVVTLVAYLAPIVSPVSITPLAALGPMIPLFWGLSLVFGVYWLLKRDSAVWISVLTLILGMDSMSNAFALAFRSKTDDSALRLVSLNTHAFGNGRLRTQEDFKDIGTYMRGLDADVICLQEFPRGSAFTPLIEIITAATGCSHFFRDQQGSFALFSRYPLENVRPHYFENRVNGYLQATVVMPDKKSSLFVLHLQTNAVTNAAENIANNGDLRDSRTWLTIKGMFTRYARASRTRTAQIAEIQRVLSEAPYPVLVCGDFNDVPTSYVYGQLAQNLKDAHLEAGFGLGSTYSGALPGLRIDFIMAHEGAKVLDFEKKACYFSDHKAIRATVIP